MHQKRVIQNTADFVKEVLADAEGGHDWWHVYRVWKMSQHKFMEQFLDQFYNEWEGEE